MQEVKKTRIIGVDFAPRHSAWALMETWEGHTSQECVLTEYGSVDVGPESDGFESHALKLTDLAAKLVQFQPDVLIIEDVTHFMTKPAQVLRLQGAFRLACLGMGLPSPVLVMPTVWQNFYGWRKTPGTTSKGFAKFACLALGYKISGTVGKQTVDVRDAVLIARWYFDSTNLCYSGQTATA